MKPTHHKCSIIYLPTSLITIWRYKNAVISQPVSEGFDASLASVSMKVDYDRKLRPI